MVLRKICTILVVLLFLAAFGTLCFIAGTYSVPDGTYTNDIHREKNLSTKSMS